MVVTLYLGAGLIVKQTESFGDALPGKNVFLSVLANNIVCMECVLATISGRTVELQDMDKDLEHRCPHVFDLGVLGIFTSMIYIKNVI